MRSIVLPSWIERAAGLEPRALPPHAFALTRRELTAATFAGAAASPAIFDSVRTLAEAQSVPLAEGLFGTGPLGVPLGDAGALEAAVRRLVGQLAKAPKEAAVVLPDAWARGLMLEQAELPADADARREVLRFRLKRLVPFRVEDLRLDATPFTAPDRGGAGSAPVAANGGGAAGAPTRAFATFASEALCALVEEAFSRAGIRVGWLSGTTIALHAGVCRALSTAEASTSGSAANGAGLLGVAVVDSDGFALLLSEGGLPVVWRQKSFTEGLADADRERLLAAELRLTRAFLEERLPGRRPAALFLLAPRSVEPFWVRVLADGFGVEPARLRAEHVGLAVDGGYDPAALAAILPLAGAVAREIR